MKRIGQLLEEIGFRKDSSDSVKRAFLKHLIESQSEKSVVGGVENQTENFEKKVATISENFPQQLSFDFMQDSKIKTG